MDLPLSRFCVILALCNNNLSYYAVNLILFTDPAVLFLSVQSEQN